ncbi:3'-5' exonuclease [Ascidiimonas aurantiaca]|uniref:3'-5' exonuclease n=1 Tax=Ascidiimonas aurantiaca TaxID=1685432 RepID=UPI0030EE1A48
MNLRFIRKKKAYPEYWKQYVSHFRGTKQQTYSKTTFTVFDTETTGFDFKIDRMLSIGAVKVCDNKIKIADVFERYIQQEHFNPDTVKIHGILKYEDANAAEEDILKEFLAYIENSVLVAHHAYFDVTMINEALKRQGLPKLKNKILDTGRLYAKTRINSNFINREKNYSLDELTDVLQIPKKDRHTAVGDAYITALVFLKTVSKLYKGRPFKIKYLFR